MPPKSFDVELKKCNYRNYFMCPNCKKKTSMDSPSLLHLLNCKYKNKIPCYDNILKKIK